MIKADKKFDKPFILKTKNMISFLMCIVNSMQLSQTKICSQCKQAQNKGYAIKICNQEIKKPINQINKDDSFLMTTKLKRKQCIE